MTQNSEQVKAIDHDKQKMIQYIKGVFRVNADIGTHWGKTMTEEKFIELTLPLFTEALPQQPTAPKGDGLDEPEALKRFNALMDAEKNTASAEELWEKHAHAEFNYMKRDNFLEALSEATEQLRKELEVAKKNDEYRTRLAVESSDRKDAEIDRLTAEVDHYKDGVRLLTNELKESTDKIFGLTAELKSWEDRFFALTGERSPDSAGNKVISLTAEVERLNNEKAGMFTIEEITEHRSYILREYDKGNTPMNLPTWKASRGKR